MKKKDYNKYDFLDIQQDKLHNIKQKMLNKFLIDDILYINGNYVYFCNKQYDGFYKIPKEVLNKLVKTEKHYKIVKKISLSGLYGSVSRFKPNNLRIYPTSSYNYLSYLPLHSNIDIYYINKKHIKNIDELYESAVKYYNITMSNDFNIDITTEYENLVFDIRSFKLKKLLGE